MLSFSFDMHSHSFQDTQLKLHRYVNDSPGQAVKGLPILRFPVGLINRDIHSKTLIRHAIAQFSRYRVETLQVRQWLTGTGRGGVIDSTVLRLKRQKTLFDSRPTVAWPPTTVAWPFSDFFQKFSKLLGTFKKRCLTVGRRSRDLRPLSRDRSVTFFKISPNCLKRRKNVVWQSADGRVTSDHCRVTVQWLFPKNFLIAWNAQETLFDSRSTVAWPPTTVTWPFSDFFQNSS